MPAIAAFGRVTERLQYGRHTPRRTQRQLGVVGVAALAVVVASVAALFYFTPGERTYTAVLSEAGAVEVGADVRVAGISVGKVQDLALRDDSVAMRFTTTSSVILGDATRMQIRLQTVIGGHYVMLFPAGERPLGDRPIPQSRITLPYSLIETLQDAQRPVSQVDGGSLRRSVSALTEALQRSPNSLSSMSAAASQMVTVLGRQDAAVHKALSVAEEYIRTITDSRQLVGVLVRKIALIEDQLLGRRGELLESLRITGDVLLRIAALEPAYREFGEPFIDKLIALRPTLRELSERVGQMLTGLQTAGQRLNNLLTPSGSGIDQSALTLSAPTTCVPLPGKAC